MENQSDSKEIYKNEILETEKAFAALAKNEGLQKAFLTYADEEAVLNRNNKIIKGKAAIKQYFEKQTLQDVKLDWLPDFIDVSESGDLGYTYGKYTFEAKDTSGQTITDEGIFHTVWKKQVDGKWLFVWD
jgi:ketosteroid isomerase-like protein